MLPHARLQRRTVTARLALLPLLALAACAGLPGQEPLRVNVVAVESLKGEGLEVRFAVKLRLQNPNDAPVEFDGIALDLEFNRKALASGVSGARGTVPRFGELVVTVPVSVSAFAVARQAMSVAGSSANTEWPYALRGRLSSGPFGGVAFASEGTLKLPQ